MANNPNPGWRKAADDAGKGKAAQRGWQKSGTASGPTGPKLTRKNKLTMAISGLVLLLLAVIGLILLLRSSKPVRLVVLGADYEDTRLAVPANPYAAPVFNELKDWGDKCESLDSGKRRLSVESTSVAGSEPFTEALKEVKDKGTPTVVLFITAHGGADDKGAYLLARETSLRDSEKSRHRFSKLFEQLKELPDGMNKVLIVDAAQVPSSWDLGMVHNDFARKFLQEARESKVSNLIVLAACDEDQRSWTSEDWRQSIFAHYVIEGLKGAADDPKNGGDGNSRVSAQELHNYVSSNVKQWVRHNREALQEPVLIDGNEQAAKTELLLLPPGYTYAAPEVAKIKEFAIPPDLLNEWKESQKLADSFPPPSAYAPHLWRQYLDSLVRVEQLYRADDKAAADRLLATLNELRGRIDKAGLGARDSAQNTLAMPAVLGRTLPDEQEKKLAAQVTKLWDDREPAAFKKLLTGMQEGVTEKWQKQLLRVRLCALVIDRISAEPAANLDPGCKILAALDETLNPRPAEVQFTVLLQRDLAEKRPQADLLTKALQVRLRAEEAALGVGGRTKAPLPAYSEQVYPWIRDKVIAADLKRREAQDLLLASNEGSWKQAASSLDEADKSYEAAQTDALNVRKALKARDETLAVLPYYTQWLAQQRTSDDLIDTQLVPLWKKAHELRALLEKRDAKDIKSLGDKADSLSADLTTLRATFDERTSKLTGTGLQKRWHEIEAALAVPFIEPDLRRQLLQRSRQISATLNVESANKSSEAGGVSKEDNGKMARETAMRQGRLALEMIGEEEFKRVPRPETYNIVETWVKGPDEAKWWASLVKAGDQIGFRLSQEAADAESLAKEGRQIDLDKAAEPLRTAASLGHRLDGAGAASLGTVDPVGENKRLQLHDFLCAEAERTFGDYLAADDGKMPYYRTVGLICTRDAAELVGKDPTDLSDEQKTPRLTRVAKLDKLLKEPDVLEIQLFDAGDWKPGPAALDLTAEKPEERIYRVHSPANVPEGYPVVWPKPGPQVMAVREGASEKEVLARSVLEEVGPKRQDVMVRPFSVKQMEGPARSDKTDQQLIGLYRGRRFVHRTEVALFQKPDLIVLQPEAVRTARVAVTADAKLMQQFGAEKTAIAIVLDCSGSMNEKKAGDPERRFDKVTKALEEVLAQLPAGVTISLRVFSQDDPDFLKKNPGQIPIRQLRPPTRWKPNDLGPLMLQVRRLKPTYGTPLLRSIASAKDEDFPEGFKGSRSIVVLTDGADSTFYDASDADLRKDGNTMARFMQKRFPKDAGVNLTVLSVEVGSSEEAKQQKEFKDAVESVGGRCFEVDDTTQIAGYLRKALLQMRFWIETDKGTSPPGIPLEGAEISTQSDASSENLRWITGLTPGAYTMRVRTNRDFEQRIRLEAGDSLLLNLTEVDTSGIGFQRDVYAESRKRRLDRAPKIAVKDGWILAVLQNQRKTVPLPGAQTLEGTQLMATIEKPSKVADKTTRIQQTRPGFVWFQVAAPDKDAPVNLRVYPLASYPAPAWSLDVSPWQRSAAVSLDAWFSDELPPAALRVLRNDVDGFNSIIDLANRRIEVVEPDEKVPVVIESVKHERLTIDRQEPLGFNKAGELEKDVDCLVVRLRFPPGKPYFVQVPESLGTVGQEHHFYSAAGKYTGIFWNVTKEQAQATKSLTLVSVEGAKKRATSVQKFDLGAPEVDSSRPTRPPDNYKK